MFELTKEDYLRAAEIMSNTKSYSVDYTAQILAKIIPLRIIERMKPVLSPEEIESLVNADSRTVREIAKEMGVGFNTIYRWMSGERSPDKEYQEKLLEVLNIE